MGKPIELLKRRATEAPQGEPWEYLPAVEAKTACITCGAGDDKSSWDFAIMVGFGSAGVSLNGKGIFDEQEYGDDDCLYLSDVEAVAKTRPYDDWRIYMFAPLYEHEYQRQGDGKWVLVRVGEGFA